MDFTSFAHPPNQGAELASVALSTILDFGIVAERAGDKPRDYLGGSRLGVECDRALFYEYTHAAKDPDREFSGRMLRIFERGHHAEDRMAKYLRLGGFDLMTHAADGHQLGFGVAPHPETGRPRISGHLDGVIRGWSPPDKYLRHLFKQDPTTVWIDSLIFPMLWETKGLKNSSFNNVVSKGLAKSKPIYFTQAHTYMAYMRLASCLFTIENQDTCEVYAEVLPFDRATAQTGSDKGVRVIRAGAPSDLARVAKDRTDWRCRFCDYQETCWKEQEKATAPAAGAWGAWA
jgi:hypothetical protein